MSEGKLSLVGKIIIVLVIVGCAYGGYYFLIRKKPADDPNQQPGQARAAESSQWKGNAVEIGIAYGTEKKSWLEWAVQEFGKTSDGQQIKINLIPKGSQEGAQALVAGDKTINVWAPASSLYKDTFVQDWQVKYSNSPILKEENLALTPMVFVMWGERYQAFIQKYKSLNFVTVAQALKEKGGWDAIAKKPEWGLFKLGHTRPSKSNSGLMTLVLMAYDFTGKTRDLTLKDILNTEFQDWMLKLEQAVSGLSDSTGTLMREMVLKGPSSFDAIFVYESVAIDFLKSAEGRWGELHIVYPKENMWSENPFYIIDAPWSSKEQRAAAQVFLNFLLTEPIQRESLKHGFRPANTNVPVIFADSPFSLYQRYGLQIEPGSTSEPPTAEVVNNLLAIWQR
ncbi:MAG TPA: substrate-binding domain-containing protein, partial [Blastocatellia bacterium]|nr:substrate-binding domain-containing protein [Blastocatellia bacterium]